MNRVKKGTQIIISILNLAVFWVISKDIYDPLPLLLCKNIKGIVFDVDSKLVSIPFYGDRANEDISFLKIDF